MIEQKLKRAGLKPGVYLLKNGAGKIVYIGKAKQLRNRLRSHFKPGKSEDLKHKRMMSHVQDFETIVTDSEVEALILEANLIKEHRPKYNIDLKDDKSYPYIRVTNESYPRVFVTRKIIRDGSRYFGPYTDVGNMRQLMSTVRRIFPLRTCQLRITEETIQNKKHKVCLNYHIGRCRGPCEGFISHRDYMRFVEQVTAFIQGRNRELVLSLTARMNVMSRRQNYEDAAVLRDQLKAVKQFYARQKVVDGAYADRDIVTVVSEGNDACGVVFNVRNGKIVNRQHYYFKCAMDCGDGHAMTSFVKQFYLRTDEIPGEIFFSSKVDEPGLFGKWLSNKAGKRVRLICPQKGHKAHVVAMCRKNATLLLHELLSQKTAQGKVAPAVSALEKALRLPKSPIRIEAFDISNIQGRDAVASMVSFRNGMPDKDHYRRFKIRSVKGIDDFAMMAEVVKRRYTRLIREDKVLPDLILVDGGKGQLSTAVKILKDLSIADQPVIGLAKRLEEVFLPDRSDPVILPKTSAALMLLQRIRDEAHRFAVTYHRSVRAKRAVRSVLDDIPGIGPGRRKALLNSFGSVDGIRKASIEDLTAVKGMNRKVAGVVVEFIKGYKNV